MSVGEYLAVFASIVLGLAVSDMAQSLHRLIVAGRLVKWDWLSPAMAIYVVINLLGVWWATFGWYRTSAEITVIGFLPDLTIFILVYLSAAAVLPDDVPSTGLDLRTFYLTRARYFWLLQAAIVACVVVFVAPRYAPGGWRAVAADQTENLICIPIMLFASISRRLWVQRLIVAGVLVYSTYDYVGYSMRESSQRVKATTGAVAPS